MRHHRWFASATGDEVALLDHAERLLKAQKINSDETLIELLRNSDNNSDTNLATAVFYRYLLSHRTHGPFIRQVNSTEIITSRPPQLPRMIVVPGMFAIEKPELGGDGALLIEIGTSLGFKVTTAPTNGKASLTQNARVLHEFLSTLPDENFWLVSISRGSADVKVMLSHFPRAPYLGRLRQWVNVSGIVTGSPLVRRIANQRLNSIFVRSLSRLNGMSADLPVELDCNQPYWSDESYRSTFGITHITPVPLDWHVTSAVQPRYQRLKKSGPTDGIFLLADMLAQPGYIYPIWGADHMLRVPNLADHFYKLINYLKDAP